MTLEASECSTGGKPLRENEEARVEMARGGLKVGGETFAAAAALGTAAALGMESSLVKGTSHTPTCISCMRRRHAPETVLSNAASATRSHANA